VQHRYKYHSLAAHTHTSHFMLLTELGSFHCIPPHRELNGEPMSHNISTHSRKQLPPPFKRVKKWKRILKQFFWLVSHFLVPFMRTICYIQLLPGRLCAQVSQKNFAAVCKHQAASCWFNKTTSSICCTIDISSWLRSAHFRAPCTLFWHDVLSWSFLHDKLFCVITTAHQYIP
jgi:hypothetical protein